MKAKQSWVIAAVILVFLIVLPVLPIATTKTITLLIQMFTMAALAASWNILGGYAGQVNLGHAAFFGLGALTTRLMWLNYSIPLPLSFVAGGIVAALFALIIGTPAFRLRGAYFSIGTLATAEALHLTVGNILPINSALPAAMLANYDLKPGYYVFLGLLVLIVGVSYWLQRAKWGLGMMAVREDEAAAEAIGINVFGHKLLAFVLSALLAGLVGGAYAYANVSYYYQATFTAVWTFDAVLVAFIGGVGTLAGPLVGAAFFVLVRDLLATNITNFHLIVFGVLFILVVLLLPGGLMELWDKWQARRQDSLPASTSPQASAD